MSLDSNIPKPKYMQDAVDLWSPVVILSTPLVFELIEWSNMFQYVMSLVNVENTPKKGFGSRSKYFKTQIYIEYEQIYVL